MNIIKFNKITRCLNYSDQGFIQYDDFNPHEFLRKNHWLAMNLLHKSTSLHFKNPIMRFIHKEIINVIFIRAVKA